jgi:DNA-binding transcriptional LysR family regulator
MNYIFTGIVSFAVAMLAFVLQLVIRENIRLKKEQEIQLSNRNKALEDGVADIGFVTLQTASNMKCHPLVKDRILAILPKTHLLANLEYLPVEAFSKEPVISLPEETDFDSRKVFANAGIKPNILYRTNDDYAMISMVENGLGICLVPELLLGENNKVAALETNPPSFRTIALAIPYEKHASPLVLKLQDYILNWIKENCKNSIV